MRPYTTKEKLKITAGAISALVIVGWLAVFALGVSFHTVRKRPPTEAALLVLLRMLAV